MGIGIGNFLDERNSIRFSMIFPGQGSQSVGMLSELSREHSEVQRTFSESSDILGYDLWRIVQKDSEEKLKKTSITQPAILSASISILRVWKKIGGRMPGIMAGHSLGEYSALVGSEVINFETAVRLVELRGKLMEESVQNKIGEMYAIIGLDESVVSSLCRDISRDCAEIVSISSFNSDRQVVISGQIKSIRKVVDLCKKLGANLVRKLPVSVPSHCMLMKPAAKKLKKFIEKIHFKTPKIEVINNVNAKIEHSSNKIKESLIKQMYSPVKWTKVIDLISRKGYIYFLEIGPGSVLTKLNRRIFGRSSSFEVNDLESMRIALIKVNGG
ncbi:ACP S-malonyltransferase [Candidatus Riesia pediculicola]|uniref:Malonyl CoA-acyl carrier protein transacylase n=1 Tax=Riesia pediculicola (strain USDA) TaxID=515618 RepID=D4G8I3_RIEPU|nr:ACP S-malonyltransferase [Candidatus Riesia pediculicola]ADD79930.1 malonyl CoA-acyl carrier protein transacylase [Candidatus Riesia pediculicola USDA]ARC53862.1 malonyl CoA-ACP transacylase [Candidatus Riesia pediculicola]